MLCVRLLRCCRRRVMGQGICPGPRRHDPGATARRVVCVCHSGRSQPSRLALGCRVLFVCVGVAHRSRVGCCCLVLCPVRVCARCSSYRQQWWDTQAWRISSWRVACLVPSRLELASLRHVQLRSVVRLWGRREGSVTGLSRAQWLGVVGRVGCGTGSRRYRGTSTRCVPRHRRWRRRR